MSKKTNTIELSIIERIGFQQLVPEQGSFADLLHAKNIMKKVEISSEEADRLHLRTENGNITWRKDADTPISVTFTPVEMEVIRTQIDKLDKDKRIHISMFDVIQKLKA